MYTSFIVRSASEDFVKNDLYSRFTAEKSQINPQCMRMYTHKKLNHELLPKTVYYIT